MGPRIFIRGYTSAIPRVCRSRDLQWGRGFSSADTRTFDGGDMIYLAFNGAADFHPRIRTAGTPLQRAAADLQWGRGFSSADTTKAAALVGHIRFLQWGRGFSSADTCKTRWKSTKKCPSMGPRIFIRGYISAPSTCAPGRSLQWGRGFSSADTWCARDHGTGSRSLQWGRGFSSADTWSGSINV